MMFEIVEAPTVLVSTWGESHSTSDVENCPLPGRDLVRADGGLLPRVFYGPWYSPLTPLKRSEVWALVL